MARSSCVPSPLCFIFYTCQVLGIADGYMSVEWKGDLACPHSARPLSWGKLPNLAVSFLSTYKIEILCPHNLQVINNIFKNYWEIEREGIEDERDDSFSRSATWETRYFQVRVSEGSVLDALLGQVWASQSGAAVWHPLSFRRLRGEFQVNLSVSLTFWLNFLLL